MHMAYSRCKEHGRYSCWESSCRTDNAGSVSVDVGDGDLAVGIGGGLTIDSEGDLGMQIAPGVSIDFDGD